MANIIYSLVVTQIIIENIIIHRVASYSGLIAMKIIWL